MNSGNSREANCQGSATLRAVAGAGGDRFRLAILDDHTLVTAGLAALLERDASECVVVWQGTLAVDLITALDDGLTVDVVLLDVLLGDHNPRASVVAEQLVERGIPALLVTMTHGGPQTKAALLAGASDIVPKDAPESELLAAIRCTAAGETLWSRRAVAILGEALGPHLSRRETEVVRLYVQGMLIKTIARRMGIEENTANTYLKRVRAKFRQLGKEVDTREQLRSVAEEEGIIDLWDQ